MSAVRALRQLSGSSLRLARVSVASRAAPIVARSALAAATPAARAFSMTARRFGSGTTDVAVSQKLQEELQYEEEVAAQDAEEGEPTFLKDFKEAGNWKIVETSGKEEVTLTRQFGNETINLVFSASDVQSMESEEPALEEEGAEEEEPTSPHSYPIRVAMNLTKQGAPGTLSVDMVCQDGHFVVDNIAFYRDTKVGSELTAEADWARRALYIGPQFDSLDIGLQEEFEKFLQERGVNEALALFIPEYAEYKEQKEYVRWLKDVKTFVDA
ncbi:mitochondrial glycoprotein [Schizophyllum fasciatum]